MEDPLPSAIFICSIILLKGFLVLIETAFISSRKTRLRAWAEGGDKKSFKVLEAMEQYAPFVGSLRIGIIFLGILSGMAGGLTIAAHFQDQPDPRSLPGQWGMYLAAAAGTAGITLIAVLIGDVIPKQIARSAPERIIAGTLPFLLVLPLICKPLLMLSAGLSNALFKVLRIETYAPEGMTEDELRIALAEGEKSGIVESEERSMVEGVFYLGERPVGAFMRHRSEITVLDLHATQESIRSTAVEHRDQRYFPVVDGSLDELAGVVSAEDILLAFLDGQWRGLKAIMKPPTFVPETMSALKAFEAFKKGAADFLLVMDEYGGFAGALSVGNLVEEIVGQISAPDRSADSIIKQEDGGYLVDGNVNIDEISDVLGIVSPLGEHPAYHTVAGFILSLSGEIPQTGAYFEYGGYRFQVLDMEGNRIDKVSIYPLD
ncbi:MAG: hemolysin family protein [Spirochaetaceae bacterium]|jgi:putative hemolysin|nr:hemolysin family protein [Spirochaetaceae bacterium]